MSTFSWPYEANSVHVTGSFNNWSERIPLPRGDKGVFHTTINLQPGEYEYKFIIDGRRWCYDILKPTKRDDKGNCNNHIIVGRGQSAPPKGKEQAAAASPAQPKEEAPKQQQKQQQEQGGKKEKQQQQQQKKEQNQNQGGKKEKGGPSAAAKGAAQKVISTVKSYNAPWFVADVDIEDNLQDVIATANLFGQALPDSACMFLASGPKSFVIVALVPESKVSGANAIELINTALTVVADPPKPEGTNNLAHAVVAANPDAGVFPLKLKDVTRGPVFALLKKKGLVKEEDDDDDDLPAWDF